MCTCMVYPVDASECRVDPCFTKITRESRDPVQYNCIVSVTPFKSTIYIRYHVVCPLPEPKDWILLIDGQKMLTQLRTLAKILPERCTELRPPTRRTHVLRLRKATNPPHTCGRAEGLWCAPFQPCTNQRPVHPIPNLRRARLLVEVETVSGLLVWVLCCPLRSLRVALESCVPPLSSQSTFVFNISK
jgi:hypothetical protein